MGNPERPATAADGPASSAASGWLDLTHRVTEPERDVPSARTFVAVLKRRRGTILAVLFVTLVAVAGGTALLPRIWESSTTILVEERTRGAETSALEVLERLGLGNQAETEIELIKSRRVVEPVVDELDLHVRLETANGTSSPGVLLPEFTAAPSAEPGAYRFVRLRDGGYSIETEEGEVIVPRAGPGERVRFAGVALLIPRNGEANDAVLRVASFASRISAVQGLLDASQVRREGDLIRLRCRSASAVDARALCDAVTRSYVGLRTELQRVEATATAAFLGEQVAGIERRLEAAEDSLEVFARTNQVVALEERAAEEVRHLAARQAELEQLRAERSALRRLIAQIGAPPDESRDYRDLAGFPTFLRNAAVSQLLASLLAADEELSRLAALRTERNADLRAADDRVRELETRLHDLAASYERALGNEIVAMETTLARSGRRLSAIPTRQVEYARLQRQALLFDELYRFLETRRREAEVAEAVELPSVRVVDHASLAEAPASPKPRRNLALALFLGLAGGVGLGVVRDLADPRILERGDIRLGPRMPILGLIPSVREPGPLLSATREGGRVVVGSPPTLFHNWDQQLALEAFRSVVADLRFLGRERGRPVRSVAVTSAGPGEGKTFVACNLALARALHAGRTMLVDADMRASRVAEFLGCPATPGLSEVLAGLVEARSVATTLRVEESGKLWVIPAGTPTPHSAALLEERLFERLVGLVRDNVDLLIVDTPPLNVLADAATIASSVDAVLVVVRRGVTDREGLRLTLERLARTGVPSINVIFNDVDLPKRYATYTYRYAPVFGDPYAEVAEELS